MEPSATRLLASPNSDLEEETTTRPPTLYPTRGEEGGLEVEAGREKMEKRPVVEEDYKDEEDVGGKGKEKVSSSITRRNSREESAYQPSPKLSSSRRSVGCPICFEPIRDPRLLRVCGHTFCYGNPPLS